ncbi:hypothetical protein OOK31_23395 [Streptomyces sp. NBC_00249]|uniref:hypothetical protein n=1 Tax=Streptomyces sp. NBC_00249 TaxID=2975690 RepID=UPI00225191D8|nr:hypothetical protein [Streptomyces sp. NBC_00249]MCX5196802.1 hypothetical protein [Streptomyces sp. NBC_00249]
MGMTVLYIAFGIVALWLLAEVLMQYKARLRWRLLAFAGFLGVVAGVVLPSVLVIAAGATAFAVGQTLVTLSFRKGFVAGWALRRGGEPVREDRGRRRRGGGTPRPEAGLEVSGLEYGSDTGPAAVPSDDDQVFTPQPVPEDTGSYGIQSFAPQQPDATAAFASPFTTPEQDAHQYAAYQDPQQGQGAYDYSTGYQGGEQQVYAAYSDPYIGTGGAVAPQQPYDYTPYADYSQQQYSMDTPPGGIWVPQQRATDTPPDPQAPDPDAPQGYPYHQDNNNGYRY